MVHFGEFLKTWSLRSNSVTTQVSFSRTKIGGKCQNWTIQMRHFEWFSNTVSSLRPPSLTFRGSFGKAHLPNSAIFKVFAECLEQKTSSNLFSAAEAPEDAQDLQVKNLKSQIASLQLDLSQKSTETLKLESLLKVALSKIHPDKVQHLDDKDENLWQEYVNLQ